MKKRDSLPIWKPSWWRCTLCVAVLIRDHLETLMRQGLIHLDESKEMPRIYLTNEGDRVAVS